MKEALREILRELRNSWTRDLVAEKSEAITRRVLDIADVTSARRVGVYLATAVEPDTSALIAELRARSIELAIPGYNPATRTYTLKLWPEGATLQPGRFDLPEPVNTPEADDLDVILVPGLAFDAMGFRLGHGGGHFDRILATTSAVRIGLCFDAQRLPDLLPSEPHDIPMHLLVTESSVITFEPSRSLP